MNIFNANNLTKITVFARAAIRNEHLINLGKCALYSTDKSKFEQTNEDGTKKLTQKIPKITLIEGEKMQVLTLEQAKKIAEKRQLKLVNVIDYDAKSSRAIYKLMTSHEYHAEELKRREEKKEARNQPQIKSEKLLSIGNKISENDLIININKCKKWISKLHEIRVVISADDGDAQKAEKIANTIEKEMKSVEGRILQKRAKDNNIRFTIMPTIKKPDHAKASGNLESEKKFLQPDNLNIQQARSVHISI